MTNLEHEATGLTGNPFVDTGLAVIAALLNLDSVESLTLEQIQRAYGDGNQLSSWNSRLKSFSQVFGTNNPLFQTAYGYTKGKGPSETNHKIYRATLGNFLSAINGDSGQLVRCEACGGLARFDFAQACFNAVRENGQKAVENKWVGRDWFPLAGSMGSDAQALPVASRPVHLCARCLFAVHYLLLGIILFDGRLAVFQSTSAEFWYELVRDIVNVVKGQINAGKYDTLGAKEGSRSLAVRLLELFERLQQAKRFSALPPATALEVWRFTNSNPPDCELTEIPNSALAFLWEAVQHGLRNEIQSLLGQETKKDAPFLNCILERRDYRGLYPRGKWKGASPKLFALYQTHVCGRTPRALTLAHILASKRAKELGKKELERLKREEAFSEPSLRTQFRGMIARLTSEGEFTLEDYLGLFPLKEEESGIRVAFDGWNLIRYYFHHLDDFKSLQSPPLLAPQRSCKLAVVRYCAARIMQDYIGEFGSDRFRSDVLNRMARGDIGTGWLSQQFVRLAGRAHGFNYEAWKRLCSDDRGHVFVRELLFQMRLLWGQWVREDYVPEIGIPELPNGSGLPVEAVERLKYVFSQYVERRGLKRFQADVLTRLRRRDIGLGWFRRQLPDEDNPGSGRGPLNKGQWEEFLRDEEGRPCAGERLFQMRLLLANLYREADDSKKEVVT